MKRDFPAFGGGCKDIVYLDNAATTQKPRVVLDAILSFYEDSCSNVGRAMYNLANGASEQYSLAREVVARHIGTRDSDEVVFTGGATDSLNAAAQMIGGMFLRPVVAISHAEHHSNWLPWHQMSGRRIRTIALQTDRTARVDLDDLRLVIQKLQLHQDRLDVVAINQASNVTGVANELVEIYRAIKSWSPDTIVVVDGTQGVPHDRQLDVPSFCDVYAFSGHKVYGPMGIGVLWARRDLWKSWAPFRYGGGMVRDAIVGDWNVAPYRFEAGTPNVAGAVGLAAALKWLGERRDDEFHRENALADRLRAFLEQWPRAEWVSAGPSPIVSFTVGGASTARVGCYLASRKIAVRAGKHCAQPLMVHLGLGGTVRASFGLYNDEDDLDRLISALSEME